MNDFLNNILSIYARIGPGSLALAGLLASIAIALYALHLRFKTKGVAAVLALCKWLAVFGMLRALDAHLPHDAYDTTLFILSGVAMWMAFRALLSVYATVYLGRIKHRPANKILLNLLSLFAALLLLAYGLRSLFDVDVSSLLTSSAILTAVIGFSLQDTIGSLFSGILLQAERPFSVGDWIKVGESEGQVTSISWRYTTLITSANDKILIPNNSMAKERIVNYSRPTSSVNVVVSVPAPLDAPPVKVKSALQDVLRKASLVDKTPVPTVRLAEIGPDCLTYRLSFYTPSFDASTQARNEVLSGAWYEFMRQRIEFPMTRRQILPARRKTASYTDELDIESLVSGASLFKGMPLEELELLAQCAAIRVYQPQAHIVERGQTGTTMFIIAAGEVSISGTNGTEVARLGPGNVFGEMALLTGEPRTANVTAVDPVTCLEIDREAFRLVLEKSPVLLANVHRVFEERASQHRDMPHKGAPKSSKKLFKHFQRIFW